VNSLDLSRAKLINPNKPKVTLEFGEAGVRADCIHWPRPMRLTSVHVTTEGTIVVVLEPTPAHVGSA